MNRWIYAFLPVMLAASMLTGCQGTDPAATGPAANFPATNNAAPSDRSNGAPSSTATPGLPPATSTFFSTDAYCYTPARDARCRAVRFGWGDCPGSRQACDWCYGPEGVFAYTPRGSVYTLKSECNSFGPDTIWSTRMADVADWMTRAGGNCTSDGRGGYACAGVDPARFIEAAKRGG